MAAAIATTCQLCLQAEDPSAVVFVKLPHAMIGTPQPTPLCRRCAFAIVEATRATDEPAPSKGVIDEPSRADRPTSDHGDLPGAEGVRDVVLEDQPPAKRPRGHRGKPEDATER